jgi:aryl-alcohol dehydrogenase-like predicted oxidoreductase
MEIDDCSPIGFGTYRWSGTPRQVEALHAALDSGCNLIDTAPNYGDNSRAEYALGKEIDHQKVDVFVITKAGYLHEGERAPDSVLLSDRRSSYSLHPDLLERRIVSSMRQLRRDAIDGFLLHNPEHLLDTFDDITYESNLKRAFEYCESRVDKGWIRHYGVSSNTIALPLNKHCINRIDRILRLAGPSFKLLEFPFNIAEREALDCELLGESMLSIASSAGVTTFGNRPFNMKTAAGPVRLVDSGPTPERASINVLEDLAIAVEAVVGQAGAMSRLVNQWHSIKTLAAADFTLNHVLSPLTQRLSHVEVVQELFQELRTATFSEVQNLEAVRAASVLSEAGELGSLVRRQAEPLVRAACRAYLGAGLDHVLAGMRTIEQVESLSPLMQKGRDLG